MNLDSITELWDSEIPIIEYSEADFEGRSASLSVYDTNDVYRLTLEQLSAATGLGPMESFDFGVRLYIAALCDIHEYDIRRDFDQVRLVPPRGWLHDNRDTFPTVSIPIEQNDSDPQQFCPGSPHTVRSMIHACLSEYDMHEGLSDFDRAAITFLVDLFEGYRIEAAIERPRLHER